MNDEAIKTLARYLSEQMGLQHNIVVLIIGAILGLGFACTAAFFVSYSKRSGENKAQKESLGLLTEIVEKIKTSHAMRLENYKFMQSKAEQVTELLANQCLKDEKNRKAQKIIWELSMWLPSDLVRQLTILLVEQGEFNPKEMVIGMRKLFHGSNDDLKPDQIAHVIEKQK